MRQFEVKITASSGRELAMEGYRLFHDYFSFLGNEDLAELGLEAVQTDEAVRPDVVHEESEEPVTKEDPEPVTGVITKDMLKAILYKVRDERGSNRVAYLYSQYGNGATSLKTLKEEDYPAMYAACKEAINAAE